MNQQIYEEAAEWLVELRTSRDDAVTRERFDQWLSRSPEHVRAYLECTAISETLEAGPRAAPHELEGLIERARQSADKNVIALPPVHSSGAALPGKRDGSREAARFKGAWRRIRFAIAASVVLVVIGASVDYYTSRNVYATAIGDKPFKLAIPLDGLPAALDRATALLGKN
jgi:ferric-dicitrate binding protein FerR (iron transport regulator)